VPALAVPALAAHRRPCAAAPQLPSCPDIRRNPEAMAAMTALSGLAGCLLGSLSPAYALGRLLRGSDVRQEGFRNAGTRNVYHLPGPLPAAVTGVVDLGKGLATAAGIYLFLCALAVARGRFSPATLAAVLGVSLLVFLASHSGDLTGLVGFCALSVLTPIELGFGGPALFLLSLALYLFGMSIRNVIRQGVFRFDPNLEMKWWRVIARPFALLFIPVDLLFGRTPLLFLLGAVALVFSVLDLVRLLSRYEFRQLLKKKETKRFSSMSSFLVATFIMFLVFPDNVPYLGLAYITIGDLFSKIIGVRYGKTALLRERTLQGSLGFLAGSFLAGWVVYLRSPIPLYVAAAGPVFAAGVELFSMDLDDNFTVGILSSGFIFALRYFL
jgi:glycerol-3-phosphate acyltransferase PlsY